MPVPNIEYDHTNGQRLILISPDGTKFEVQVDNDGIITTVEII